MSRWTHIVGCLYIETFKERKNIKKYVEDKLKLAPKITGSELDADIFVNPLSGYNLSSWTKNNKNVQYQTCVAITIVGDLRDRDIGRTTTEIKVFLDFIKRNFDIFYHSISIYDELLGKTEFIFEEEN